MPQLRPDAAKKKLNKKNYNKEKNLKIELPYDPAIPLLGIYLKEFKEKFQRNIGIPIFMAALFTVARRWKQPKCPSTEWINKMWYIHDRILFSLKMKFFHVLHHRRTLTFMLTE